MVAFDLDGTLVDTAPDLMGALNTLLGEEGLPLLADAAVPLAMACGASGMIERCLAAAGPRDDGRAARMCARYVAMYRDRIADLSAPFDGVLDALDALDVEGAVLAVCTNKRTDLARALLDELNLTGRFMAIVGADLAPRPKPDASHLLHTIQRVGGDPSRALMVGDSVHDVLMARSASVPVVLVSFGYAGAPPRDMHSDGLIDRFGDLHGEALRLVGRAC